MNQDAAHRLCRPYHELMRAEVARAIDDPARVDDEIRSVFAALSGYGSAGRGRGRSCSAVMPAK